MIRRGDVPEGYKQTKVGIIPGEWEVVKVSDIAKLGRGRVISTKEINRAIQKKYPVYSSQTSNNGIMGYIDTYDFEGNYITWTTDGANAGKVFNRSGRFNCTNVCGTISLKKGHYKYISSILDENTKHYVSRNLANPKLMNNTMKSIILSFPPLPEQTTIAQILSTADKAIETTETLITLKQQKKKWLMQNLLTGKVRLPEYDNCPVPVQERIRLINDGMVPEGYKQTKVGIIPVEWEEMQLKKHGETYSGLSGKNKEDFGSGKPYIPYKNIFLNSKIDEEYLDYVRLSESEKQHKVKYGDVFFTTSSEIPEETGLSSVLLDNIQSECYLNSFCFGYRLHNFKSLSPHFLRFFLRGEQFRRSIIRLAQGSTRFNISKKFILNLFVFVPSITEQTAIANVLSTADKEIDLLKQKLDTLKQQKKALMQLLLTGIVRTTGLKTN